MKRLPPSRHKRSFLSEIEEARRNTHSYTSKNVCEQEEEYDNNAIPHNIEFVKEESAPFKLRSRKFKTIKQDSFIKHADYYNQIYSASQSIAPRLKSTNLHYTNGLPINLNLYTGGNVANYYPNRRIYTNINNNHRLIPQQEPLYLNDEYYQNELVDYSNNAEEEYSSTGITVTPNDVLNSYESASSSSLNNTRHPTILNKTGTRRTGNLLQRREQQESSSNAVQTDNTIYKLDSVENINNSEVLSSMSHDPSDIKKENATAHTSRSFNKNQQIYENHLEIVNTSNHNFEHELIEENSTYSYANDLHEIHEQIDVVEGEAEIYEMESMPELIDTAGNFGAPVDLRSSYTLMNAQKYHNNDDLIADMYASPEMSNHIDILRLMDLISEATPEYNAQLMTGLAMQVNLLKKDMLRMRCEINDLRHAHYLREEQAFTHRRFLPSAQTTCEWKIMAEPPLRAVDLVKVARDLHHIRGGKKFLNNKDAITKFVKAVLEQLIPREVILKFTVRDRAASNRDSTPHDIGIHIKDQIIGIVLDLLGLYHIENLDNLSRADRAFYAQLTNNAMKTAIYDMRRTSPKRRREICHFDTLDSTNNLNCGPLPNHNVEIKRNKNSPIGSGI